MVEIVNLAKYKNNKEPEWPSKVFIPIDSQKLRAAHLEIIRMANELNGGEKYKCHTAVFENGREFSIKRVERL